MSSRSAQAHKNINVIQRHVNWRQMELFFSLRAEGRENKLPFSLVANRERKSLSGRGNCTVCWKTSSACFLLLCCLLFTILFYYLCIIVRKCQPAHVSMCHWGCHQGSQYHHCGRQCLNGSADKFGLLSHINMHECRYPGSPRPINMCHFRFSLHYPPLPPRYLLQKMRLWPTSLTLSVISTSCGAGWACVFWCQIKFCAHIMMSENILAFLGGLDWLFCLFS